MCMDVKASWISRPLSRAKLSAVSAKTQNCFAGSKTKTHQGCEPQARRGCYTQNNVTFVKDCVRSDKPHSRKNSQGSLMTSIETNDSVRLPLIFRKFVTMLAAAFRHTRMVVQSPAVGPCSLRFAPRKAPATKSSGRCTTSSDYAICIKFSGR